MATLQNVSTPVAPTVGAQGTSTPGGHYVQYKAQSAFAPTATIELISGSNPWRPNTPGFFLWVQVLSQSGCNTVAKAIELAAKAKNPQKASEVQKHLRWLYTWGGSYLRVNGAVFVPPPAAPKAPAKARKSAKAS